MPRKKEEIKNLEIVENKTDTKKIERELIEKLESKKEELLKDMISTMNDHIEINVGKRMKELEKRYVKGKNAKIFRRDMLIILLVAIIGYFGYCLYDVDYFHIRMMPNSDTVDKKEENKPVEDKKEDKYDASYYIENYGYLVDNMQIEDNSIFDLYQDTLTRDSISNELKLKISYRNLKEEEKEITDSMITVSPMILLNSYQNIFGKQAIFTNEMFTYNHTRFMYYQNIYIGYIEEEEPSDFLYKISNAYLEKEKLIFEVVVAKKEENNLINFKTSEIVVKDYQNDDILIWQGDLEKYQFTFIEEDGSYYFERLENYKG